MSEAPTIGLEAKSPFELRVHLGDSVPEQSVRDALATGDMGVSTLLYDRFDGGWARCARRGVDNGLHVALPVLPQPGHMDDEQRQTGVGRERR